MSKVFGLTLPSTLQCAQSHDKLVYQYEAITFEPRLTTTWFGPFPWISQSIPIGPPLSFATCRRPRELEVKFQTTFLKAGCACNSETLSGGLWNASDWSSNFLHCYLHRGRLECFETCYHVSVTVVLVFGALDPVADKMWALCVQKSSTCNSRWCSPIQSSISTNWCQ